MASTTTEINFSLFAIEHTDMDTVAAATERDQALDRIELLIVTLVFGSVVGALIYAAATGQRYNVGDSVTLRDPLSWFGIAVRGWFCFTSRFRLARVGWGLGLALALLTILTPLGNSGAAAWAARAVSTMTWTGIVATAVGATVDKRWRTVALVVLVLEVALRFWALQNWDAVTGRSTVLWG